MKILITGSKGFVGSNLVERLSREGHTLLTFDVDNTIDELDSLINEADFIFHLAGVNRPKDTKEFGVNSSLTETIISLMKKNNKDIPIVFTSSTQVLLDNEYGKSKKEAEDLLLNGNLQAYVCRCPNLFGKWCRPNYNSVIATFCYNIAHNIEISVNKEASPITFLYIDDLLDFFMEILKGNVEKGLITDFPVTYRSTPCEIADILKGFRDSRTNFNIPFQVGFTAKLYATYLTYLEPSDFSYDVIPHIDDRGSFTELYKTPGFGQTSVNVIKPGITKGNHYHHTKNEKFIVLSGECEIKFRKINTNDVISIKTSGNCVKIVDIIPGYTHSITNIGKSDAVVLMWASQLFDPEHPDTYFEEV